MKTKSIADVLPLNARRVWVQANAQNGMWYSIATALQPEDNPFRIEMNDESVRYNVRMVYRAALEQWDRCDIF